MIIGLMVGYLINASITKQNRNIQKPFLLKSGDPQIIKKVESHLDKLSEKQFKENKKQIASRFSILSDIFLRLIKMILRRLYLQCW